MDYYDKIISLIEPPYFKNLESMGIDRDHYNVIFERIYNEKITILGDKSILDDNGNRIYYENSNGNWL